MSHPAEIEQAILDICAWQYKKADKKIKACRRRCCDMLHGCSPPARVFTAGVVYVCFRGAVYMSSRAGGWVGALGTGCVVVSFRVVRVRVSIACILLAEHPAGNQRGTAAAAQAVSASAHVVL
jgi:hypothetical protein